MTYEAEVQFKFDATFTPTYGTSSWTSDDFIPEEHYLITAPAADLNCKQYFKLFEKFLLCVGMDAATIRSSAMSLVFNDYTGEEEQRKVCKEYELTMDEDLEKKYQEYKERDAQWAKLKDHYNDTFGSEPKIKGDDDAWEITDPHGTFVTNKDTSNHTSWEERYWQMHRRFQHFAKYTDDQLMKMRTVYETFYSEDVDSASGVA